MPHPGPDDPPRRRANKRRGHGTFGNDRPPVAGVATVPGAAGVAVAFGAELAISFVLMLVVLTLALSPRAGRYTGVVVGAIVCLYIVYRWVAVGW